MDYRMEIVEQYPGSRPSRVRFEEFHKETDEDAREEYKRRAEKLREDNESGDNLEWWCAGGFVRIDQREITTRIPVTPTKG